MLQIINDFLQQIPPDARTVTWYIFIILLVVIACILTGVYCFQKVKSAKTAATCGGLAFAAFAGVIAVALLVEKLTNDVVLLSGVTYYIPYLICASYVLSKYLRCNMLWVSDVISLAYLPARAVNIIGCTVAGCCQGVPAEWGIYSPILKTNVIPVQLVESFAIFVIWSILNCLHKRDKTFQNGKCAVLSVVLFGALNVITDIFTYIQPKIIYMISVEGIFAFLTMCAGLVMLYILDRKQTPGTTEQDPYSNIPAKAVIE